MVETMSCMQHDVPSSASGKRRLLSSTSPSKIATAHQIENIVEVIYFGWKIAANSHAIDALLERV